MEYQHKRIIENIVEDTAEDVEIRLNEHGKRGWHISSSVLVGNFVFHYLVRENP